MADVRALLRAERAARSEPAKPKKVATQTLPLQQISSNKKRKSPDVEYDAGEEARKRAREDNGVRTSKTVTFADEQPLSEVQETPDGPEDVDEVAAQDIDEDEWAAFERDVATPPPEPASVVPRQTALSALNSNTAISAAPTTTTYSEKSELDKRKEEQKAQRERREEEVEADKEDAVRNMEDEFEEMDALEERVRRLKERREMLRSGAINSQQTEVEAMIVEGEGDDGGLGGEEESDEDIDDDDVWAFGKR